MKVLYIILILIIFSFDAFAEELDNAALGIVRQLISEDSEEKKDEEISESAKKFKPNLKSFVTYDVSLNDEYQSTNRKQEFKDTRSRGRFVNEINFTDSFSFNSFLRLARVNQASEDKRRASSENGGGDRTFENEGIFVEELNFSYKHKKQAFVLGKFNLNFGTAWRFNRGLSTYNIAEGYRHKEKLGINGIYQTGDSKKNGRYELSYAIFTNDRKNLDNSIITKRDSTHKSDALPGDTRSLKSYITSLDINFDFSEKEKLSYHFSYLDLAIHERASEVPSGRIEDQKSWVAGINYKYPINDILLLDNLLEYTDVKNFGGDSNVNQKYLTANTIVKIYNNWNVTLGYARQHQATLASESFDKNLTEISAGYTFRNKGFFDRLLFQFGYKNQRDNYKTSLETRNSLGFLMRYQKEF